MKFAQLIILHVMNIKSLIIRVADVNVYITVIQKFAKHHLYGTLLNAAVPAQFNMSITDALEEKYTIETHVVVLAIKSMLKTALK